MLTVSRYISKQRITSAVSAAIVLLVGTRSGDTQKTVAPSDSRLGSAKAQP